MKHLLYQVKAFFRRVYFRLGVVLTLGLRDGESQKKTSEYEELAERSNDHGSIKE